MSEFLRVRNISLAVALALGAGACSATTTEGVMTAQCVDGVASYKLAPNDSLYLGDLSSDDSISNGPHQDWAKAVNKDGAIRFEQDSSDEGKIVSSNGGFNYSENGHKYSVKYSNSSNDINAVVDVTVETNC